MTKILLSTLAVTLFFSVIYSNFSIASENYDLSDVNESSFIRYGEFNKTFRNYTSFTNSSLGIQADQGAFDVLGNLVSKALSPFKTAYNGIKLGKDSVVSQLNFIGTFLGVDISVYIDYFLGALGVIMTIGLLLFKVYFKSDDGV